MKIHINLIDSIGLLIRALGGVTLCMLASPSIYAGNELVPGKSDRNSLVAGAQGEARAVPASNADRSYLTKVWNLDNKAQFDSTPFARIVPYRQIYFLVNSTNSPNRQPYSPAVGNATLSSFDIDATEVTFQLSAKTHLGRQQNFDFLGIKTLRFWGAYTQQSHWQAFNIRNSSPLRETIFEPELIATLGCGQASGLKLINLGWVHQSNGRPIPESRSWQRIYLLGGWEWNDTSSVQVRVWQRIPENSLTDANPDIGDYQGRADLLMRWEPMSKNQFVSLLLRNNLKQPDSRSYIQIDWETPVKLGNAGHMHIQTTSGYGSSLIDYNHRQNTLGLGISFREW